MFPKQEDQNVDRMFIEEPLDAFFGIVGIEDMEGMFYLAQRFFIVGQYLLFLERSFVIIGNMDDAQFESLNQYDKLLRCIIFARTVCHKL